MLSRPGIPRDRGRRSCIWRKVRIVHAEERHRMRARHSPRCRTTGGSRRAPLRLERRISGRSVLRNNTSIPERGDLRNRGAQVLEVRIAVGTPATAIEDEHGGFRELFRLEQERLAIGFAYRERGSGRSDVEWFDPGRVVGRCAARSRGSCQSHEAEERGCESFVWRCINTRPAVWLPYFSTCEALAGIRGDAHV